MQTPFRGRAVIEERSNSLLVQIPAAKSWFMLLFLPFWLCGWGYGLFLLVRSLLEGRTNSGFASASPMFLLVWDTGWIIGGGLVLLSWVRLAFGVEVSEFTAQSVSVGEKILTIDRGRSYDGRSISRLRTPSACPPRPSLTTRLCGAAALQASVLITVLERFALAKALTKPKRTRFSNG